MRKSGRITTLSLLGALLAGWLSLTCAHCWAQAPQPDPGSHCQHDLSGDTVSSCCDHDGDEEVCPGAEVGVESIAELTLLSGTAGVDLPPAMAADSQPWPSLRTPPPQLLVTIQPSHPCTALYLRHCTFLE